MCSLGISGEGKLTWQPASRDSREKIAVIFIWSIFACLKHRMVMCRRVRETFTAVDTSGCAKLNFHDVSFACGRYVVAYGEMLRIR